MFSRMKKKERSGMAGDLFLGDATHHDFKLLGIGGERGGSGIKNPSKIRNQVF
jgi:hypothetical protein